MYMDINENYNLESIWPADSKQDEKIIAFCRKILSNLSDKDQLLVDLYFRQGLTEEEIAPKVGFSGQTGVSDFKKRVFAKIKMFCEASFTFVPVCVLELLNKKDPTLGDFFLKLSKPNYINKIADEQGLRALVHSFLFSIDKVLQQCAFACSADCKQYKKCKKAIQQKRDNHVFKKLFPPVGDNPIKENFNSIIKIHKYLLQWRIFDNVN